MAYASEKYSNISPTLTLVTGVEWLQIDPRLAYVTHLNVSFGDKDKTFNWVQIARIFGVSYQEFLNF